MEYLKQFSAFLLTGDKSILKHCSAQVQADLQKTRDELQADGVVLDIEPEKVEEKTEITSSYTIVRYTGNFVYGFQKNGIFHELPGDLSSQTTRTAENSGTVSFFVNNLTNQIDRIHETFAENFWGEKISLPQASSFNLKKLLLTVVFLIIVLAVAYKKFGFVF